MSFVQPETNKIGRSLGIGTAIVFHIALVWALANGLGHKLMTAINAPIETVIIDEVKPPPPPPKVIELPPPPKFTPPPPAFVPPPEVPVQAPAPPQPTISATVAETPPPQVAEPTRAQPAPAPAPIKATAPVSASVVCSNYSQVMGEAVFPREASRLGLEEGSAVIQFTLAADGEVKDIKAVSASHPSFAKGSLRIVAEYKCKGMGRDVTVQVPFAYKSS